MRITFLVVLLVAGSLGGCLDAVTGAFTEDDPAVAPGPYTFEGLISPQLRRSENFTVPERMASLSLSAEIFTQGSPNNQIPTPAQLNLQLFSSGGQAVGERRSLNPQAPAATVEVTRPVADSYELRMDGMGLAGNGQGASYRVIITLIAEA